MDNFWKFATVAVAVIAAFIGFQQFWISNEKLKLDLFDKRFAVFAAARRFLSQILQHGTFSTPEEFGQYRADIAEAAFLFGEDVADFLDEIDRRALHLWSLNETLKGTEIGPERTTLVEEIGIEVEWLNAQLLMLRPTFEPYMKFTNWRHPWLEASAAVRRWARDLSRTLRARRWR
jgi:hypothetical protein